MSLAIRKTANYFERAERLNDVRENYRAFRTQVEEDFILQHDDGRLAFLRNVSQLTRTAIVFLRLIHQCDTNPEFGNQVFKPPTQDDLKPELKFANKFIKLSWCTQYQFQLETLFKNLLRALGQSVPREYWEITKQIVKIFQFPNPQDAHALLNVIARIRNSQHNNGIHRGFKNTNTLVAVDGVSFEFNHGQLVQCANWDYIAHAWLNILPILRHIYYHTNVEAVASPLPNCFWP